MLLEQFPQEIRERMIPKTRDDLTYRCLGCEAGYDLSRLLYTCPSCGSLLMLVDTGFDKLKETPGKKWQRLFDSRRMLNVPALKGVYLFHELIGPHLPLEHIVYLGEGHTPVVRSNPALRHWAGTDIYFKNDGQNPSASFKDRGMASAISHLNHLIETGRVKKVLAVCASTGDTSAAAALYASYLGDKVASAVLLPEGKVTPQQLSQPLGAGAKVLMIPGVFDHAMKVVERLAQEYDVALLNSKNPWRIKGQESYSYEVAQQFDYALEGMAVVVPVGNAGNITAILTGFLSLFDLGIIKALPRVLAVQSHHADPVFRYYSNPPGKRVFEPVRVRPSVAQAAMIGNPVSMPRVIRLVEKYEDLAGEGAFAAVQVTEQEIMDSMLLADRSGHVACTQGGESLAGLKRAVDLGLVPAGEVAVLDSTAHHLKFVSFQEKYFEDSFEPEFEVVPKEELMNRPVPVRSKRAKRLPTEEDHLSGPELEDFVAATAQEVARILGIA